MTKDGIEYDFNITPYTVVKHYEGCILTYKFSSQFYMNKFSLLSHYASDKKLQKIGIEVDRTLETDILLYSIIEKRGFQIVTSHLTKIENLKDINIKITYDVR